MEKTRWGRDLQGHLVLEVNCGAGRLAGQQALKTGAMVVSLDYSRAIDAHYASLGTKRNSLVVHGDYTLCPLDLSHSIRHFGSVFSSTLPT